MDKKNPFRMQEDRQQKKKEVKKRIDKGLTALHERPLDK